MTIITFFNPTGSNGRTTAVMAMASAILEDGKQKPAVLDMTEEVKPQGHGKPSSLTVWEDRMVDCGFGFDDFRVNEIPDFEQMIRVDVHCEVDDFEYQLVDTPRRPNNLVLNMVRRSDIIIVPFRNASEATLGSKWLARHLKKKHLICGLATAIETEDDYDAARAAFKGFPVLDTYLPKVPVFERQRETGHLFKDNTCGGDPENITPDEAHIRSEIDEGCRAATRLFEEVHWIHCKAVRQKFEAEDAQDTLEGTQ